ncbi:hypothetical protein EV651_124131 [Kribbella sp. VKM Ac-2571]|nr:hypothetical protein EV651_124131 [Kribbella sp. VKM Ac-2571]
MPAPAFSTSAQRASASSHLFCWARIRASRSRTPDDGPYRSVSKVAAPERSPWRARSAARGSARDRSSRGGCDRGIVVLVHLGVATAPGDVVAPGREHLVDQAAARVAEDQVAGGLDLVRVARGRRTEVDVGADLERRAQPLRDLTRGACVRIREQPADPEGVAPVQVRPGKSAQLVDDRIRHRLTPRVVGSCGPVTSPWHRKRTVRDAFRPLWTSPGSPVDRPCIEPALQRASEDPAPTARPSAGTSPSGSEGNDDTTSTPPLPLTEALRRAPARDGAGSSDALSDRVQ